MFRKSLLCAAALGTALWTAPAYAGGGVFEVIHPDVVEGGFELEVLSGFTLDSVESGEEISVHEIAFAYSPTSFWKTTFAFEIANIKDESAEVEGFEWENLFLLPFGEGHGKGGHSHDHSDHGFVALEAVGIFAALEVPNSGGIRDGAIEVGPVAEIAFGNVETVANFLFEFPFADEENVGVSWALQVKYPVTKQIGIGFEVFGGIENAFEGESEDTHLVGPAIYGSFNLGRGRELEPRLAVLFGLNDNSPDAVLSFNLELKF